MPIKQHAGPALQYRMQVSWTCSQNVFSTLSILSHGKFNLIAKYNFFLPDHAAKSLSKGPGKRGYIVADTNVSPFARTRNICCGHKFCVRDTKNVSDFVQKHFASATIVFPVCAAQETSWATMCPQQCVLVYQGLNFWNAIVAVAVDFTFVVFTVAISLERFFVRHYFSPFMSQFWRHVACWNLP